MLKSKQFSDLLKVCSVLPALLVMPAMGAINLSSDTDIGSSEYEDGKYSSGIIDTNIQVTGGHVVLNTPTIKIENDALYSVLASNAGAVLELGTNGTDEITIHHTAAKELDKDNKVIFKAAVASSSSGSISIGNKNTSKIDITSDNGNGAYAGGNLNMTAQDITITSALHALYLAKGNATVNAGNTLTITSTAASSYGIYNSGGVLDITAGTATITSNASYGIANTGTFKLTADTATITSNSNFGMYSSGGSFDITTAGTTTISGTLGVVATASTKMNLNGDTINITGTTNSGLQGQVLGTININANTLLKVEGKKYGMYTTSGGTIEATADTMIIEGDEGGIYVINFDDKDGTSKIVLNGDDITIKGGTHNAVVALGRKEALNGAEIEITGNKLTFINDGVIGEAASVHSGEGGIVKISGKTVDIISNYWGVGAMSYSTMEISGATTIDSGAETNDAIVARGNATLKISDIKKMVGNLTFNYDEPTSGTAIDANVDITISGAKSVWDGNTIISYRGTPKNPDTDMIVTGLHLTLNDGAIWNAKPIEDKHGVPNGSYYTAVNYLTVDNATINIEDTEHGIEVEKAKISDATINDGTLHILESLELTSGLTGTGSLNIASGAIANVGDSLIDLKSVVLDGTMNAVLDTHNPLFGSADFSGEGSLSLTAKKEGEYNLTSGGNTFSAANISVTSTIFDTTVVDNNTISVALKSVDDIAADNGISQEAAQTAANLAKSSSEKLNDFGVLVQESLARGDSAAVERAHRAINPSDVSAVQSVTTNVQSNIATLAANRMAMVALGRAGGDIDMTGHGVWAHGMYNLSKLSGEFDSKTKGVAAGIDGTFNRVFTVGAGYAFNKTDVELDSRDIEIDSSTLFIYGQYKPSEWFVNATLNYTMSDYAESAVELGVDISADYSLSALAGQVAMGYDFGNGFVPEAGIRYMHISGDSYVNSLDMKMKIADTDYITAMLGGKYARTFVADDYLTLRPELRAAIKYDIVADNAATAVTMPGLDSYLVRADSLEKLGGDLGLGLTLSYYDLDLTVSYDIEIRKDYTSQTGMIRARYNF